MSSITQTHIEQTFIEMLNEQNISQITVKALVERCGISRNCFYYHFSGIPELLDTITRRSISELIASIPSDATMEESCSAFLDAAHRQKKVIMHVYFSHNRQYSDEYLLQISSYITDAYIATRGNRLGVSEDDFSTIMSFVKHEFFGQCVDWLNHRMSYDLSGEMHKICELIDRTLASLSVN